MVLLCDENKWRGVGKIGRLLNDIFVEGNNKGLSNGPILYQSRKILPQIKLTKARLERLKPESE